MAPKQSYDGARLQAAAKDSLQDARALLGKDVELTCRRA